jgi:hypothetical protein
MTKIEEFEQTIRSLDERIRPIAKAPLVDIRGGRAVPLAPAPAVRDKPYDPLEAAGVRAVADDLLERLVEFYTAAGPEQRSAIRDLSHRYTSFRWAIGWGMASPDHPMTEARFHALLVLFSIKDQGADWRDAITRLDRLCALAAKSDLPVAAMLSEVADLSSDSERFSGRPSTKAMLFDYSRRFQGNPSG